MCFHLSYSINTATSVVEKCLSGKVDMTCMNIMVWGSQNVQNVKICFGYFGLTPFF